MYLEMFQFVSQTYHVSYITSSLVFLHHISVKNESICDVAVDIVFTSFQTNQQVQCNVIFAQAQARRNTIICRGYTRSYSRLIPKNLAIQVKHANGVNCRSIENRSCVSDREASGHDHRSTSARARSTPGPRPPTTHPRRHSTSHYISNNYGSHNTQQPYYKTPVKSVTIIHKDS